MCAACEEVFDTKEAELRANYDKYIIWQKIDEIIVFMVKVAGTSRKLTADQKRQFTDRLTQIVRSREKAVQLIEQICAYKDLTSGAPVAPIRTRYFVEDAILMRISQRGRKSVLIAAATCILPVLIAARKYCLPWQPVGIVDLNWMMFNVWKRYAVLLRLQSLTWILMWHAAI